MTRSRHELIADERKRSVAFTKRMESLSKKANELSILCGVDIGMVVHKPAENNAVLWPSAEIFGERMRKFLAFPETERGKKMVIHDQYVEQRLDDERENLLKSLKKKNLMASQLLMNELLTQGKTFQEVDLVQLNDLQNLTAEMLQKLQKRDNELNHEQEP